MSEAGSMDEKLAIMRKKFGEQIASVGSPIPAPPRLATSILPFDLASGGGFPQWNISTIWGGKDTGKSLMLYVFLAHYLRTHPDRYAALVDLEQNYDTPFGDQLGIDNSRLMHSVPDYGEQAVDLMEYLIYDVPDLGVIALDSLAFLTPVYEIEQSAEKAAVGRSGLLISKFCRKAQAALIRARKQGRDVTLVFTNQLRHNIGVMFGSPHKMPGGEAAAHTFSMVVHLWGGKEEVDPDVDPVRPVWKQVKGKIEKKKGPILNPRFEYTMALMSAGRQGIRAGMVDDWSEVAEFLAAADLLGKTGDGWQILGNARRLKKDCRVWYEEHRQEVADALLGVML